MPTDTGTRGEAVVPHMVRRRSGHIVIVASGLAVTSFLGYSSYAPTKWALRGLADTLRNELLGFGIAVQIAYPPDTETPGFAHENETKPPETTAVTSTSPTWRCGAPSDPPTGARQATSRLENRQADKQTSKRQAA